MSFKESNSEPFQNQHSRENTIADLELAQQLELFLQEKIRKLEVRAAEQPDKKRFIIDQIAASREIWFKGREELLAAILAKIEAINYESDAQFEEDVVAELANIIGKFIESLDLPVEEVQRRFRIIRIEQAGDIQLDSNGVLSCSRYDDIAEIHIKEGLTPDLWKEAMSNILKILQGDESIKIIKMTSWIVAKKPALFRRLGFIVNEITDEKELAEIRANFDEGMKSHFNDPIGEARMSRDEFLNSKMARRIGKS